MQATLWAPRAAVRQAPRAIIIRFWWLVKSELWAIRLACARISCPTLKTGLLYGLFTLPVVKCVERRVGAAALEARYMQIIEGGLNILVAE